MKRFVLVILILSLIMPFKGIAEEVIKKGESLSLDKCIRIALEHHPNIMAAKSTADAGWTRIRQAQSIYYPQIEWSSDIGRSLVGPRTSLGFKTRSVTYNSYSTAVSLSQNIFDFGKTAAQVKIQRLDYDASVSDLETSSEIVTFNVKQAYFGVLQARRNRDVAAESVKQFEHHLEQAKGFFEVGTQPKYDVTKAQVDLSNSKLTLIKAENAVNLALATLDNAMGLTEAPEYDIQDNLSYEKYAISLEEALSRAYQNRPELRSAVAKRQAAEASVTLAKRGFFPVLSGAASYDFAGNSFPLSRGWNIGLTLSFPVFNGFLTTYQVDKSRFNLSVLHANEESARQSVYLDVQTAYVSLKEAEELIPVAELTVQQSQENFEIVNGMYLEGLGDPIQVTDANVTLTNAKVSYVEALYAYKIARASLEKAMGSR